MRNSEMEESYSYPKRSNTNGSARYASVFQFACAVVIVAVNVGRDVIGLAETGSGKTGAFSLPMLHTLLDNPQRLFGLILTPTRELAFQISEQVEALGNTFIHCSVWMSTLN